MEHSNEPLTLVQLREMLYENDFVGLNVLLSFRGSKCAGVIDERHDGDGICAIYAASGEWLKEKDYGKTWFAYAYPTAHIYREALKPCKYCGGEKTLYQHTNSTKLFMNTFGKAATLVTECNACPPYADCCMKGISANSAFKINFCPNCGRPLTDEAWDAIEKRIGG